MSWLNSTHLTPWHSFLKVKICWTTREEQFILSESSQSSVWKKHELWSSCLNLMVLTMAHKKPTPNELKTTAQWQFLWVAKPSSFQSVITSKPSHCMHSPSKRKKRSRHPVSYVKAWNGRQRDSWGVCSLSLARIQLFLEFRLPVPKSQGFKKIKLANEAVIWNLLFFTKNV
jgi:hypothetical protein